MENNTEALLLRIFLSSIDKLKHEMAYESIVLKAKEAGLAGATVLKGIMGYGASSVIHSYKFWEVTEKVPVVIEIVDEEAKIKSFFDQIKPMLESMHHGCMVTTEQVKTLIYKSGKA